MMVEPGEYQDVALAALEHPRRRQDRVMQPRSHRLGRTAARTECLYPDIVVAEVCINQRNIEMLPLAAALAMQQCARNRRKSMNSGRDVAHREHRRIMRSALFAAQRSNARVRLPDKIVARIVCQWSVLAESRYRAHDDLWIDF